MYPSNHSLFEELKIENLPIDQYAITCSGPLGIRNLREINDIDIIVTPKLWNTLAMKYGIVDKQGIKKIVFPGKKIEAFGKDSFYGTQKESNEPTIEARISQAKIIKGLPFESLEHVLYYKRRMNREKDQKDILLIEKILKDLHHETFD